MACAARPCGCDTGGTREQTSSCHYDDICVPLLRTRRCRVALVGWASYRQRVAATPHRTLLEKLVRESARTIEETCRAFDKKARELGEPASLSPRQLSRWMSGSVGRPRPVMQRVAEAFWGYRFEALLDKTDHRIRVGDDGRVGTPAKGLNRTLVRQREPDHGRGTTYRPVIGPGSRIVQDSDSAEEWDPVRRRTIISALTALTAGSLSPTVGLEALRHGFGQLTESDRDEWGAIAEEYGYRFYTTAPAELVDHLRDDLTILQQLMIRHPDDRDLARAAARLSIVLAATLWAAGQQWKARRWWATAWDIAAASGDRDTQVLSRSQEAVHALYEGRPLTHVLDLTDQTIALAKGHASAGLAGAMAGRAQALAMAGRADEAVDTVRAVEAVTAQVPTAEAAAADSIWGWPQHRMWHTQSYVYSRIGRISDALAAQDHALPLYSDAQGRLRAQVQMHRATCLIHSGSVGDGLRHAADALDSLPAERHNAMLHEVVRQVMAVVPQPERHRAEYDELRQRVPAHQGS